MIKLQIEEIIKKAESGITEPYLCRLSDGQEYYVKGKSATSRGLISELICAQIGHAFGLPIPSFAVAQAPPELLQLNQGAMSSLGSGELFASLRCKGAMAVTQATLSQIPSLIQRKLFLFDAWVQNEDRTLTQYGGNANLFVSAETGGTFVIDHNLAFDKTFNIATNLALHVCREAWKEAAEDLVVVDELRAEVHGLLKSLDGFAYNIPETWLESQPDALGASLIALRRADKSDFWELLNG